MKNKKVIYKDADCGIILTLSSTHGKTLKVIKTTETYVWIDIYHKNGMYEDSFLLYKKDIIEVLKKA